MSSASAQPGGASNPPATYHVELRQFPHNFCHFNLSEHELYATIVGPWAREQWIELGERKWSPHQAKLTVLEGPHLPVEQLSMGRGWRNAQRTGREVTERVLAAASAGAQATPASSTDAPQSQDEGLLAESLGLELLTQLVVGAVSLRRAWELAAARHPDRTAAQCLALAERAITSLLASSLIVLVRDDGMGDTQRPIDEAEIQTVMQAVDSWTAEIVSMARR
jgi:hypothetical protein